MTESVEDRKNYELCYLLTSGDAEAEVVSLLNQYKAVIIHQGKLTEVKLSYPIKKQSVALFGFVQFSMLPQDLLEVKKTLALNSKILRSLIISLTSKQLVPKREEREAVPAVSAKTEWSPRPVETKVSRPPVLSNEALEEKLEEILK